MLISQQGSVALWSSTLAPAELSKLTKENPASFEDDDVPLSDLAAALGVVFYDHDRLEVAAPETPQLLCELVRACSYGQSLVGLLPESLQQGLVSGVVAFYDYSFEGSACPGLVFVGNFAYTKG
jgi:hypothetical protein